VTRKKNKITKLLTEVELEVMKAIWNLKECSVRDVHDILFSERALAYTSVATMMKILEQKGFLSSQKTEKTHIYKPLVDRSEYEEASLNHLSENVFEGNPSSMVLRLLDDSKLGKLELENIRKFLNERLNSK
jgi:predicted transcriptional regulator